MRNSNIQSYAQQLVHLMGSRAENFAAEKEKIYLKGGEQPAAKDWREIKRAVRTICDKTNRPQHIS